LRTRKTAEDSRLELLVRFVSRQNEQRKKNIIPGACAKLDLISQGFIKKILKSQNKIKYNTALESKPNYLIFKTDQ
jgi:hypothetical protein